MANNSGRGHAPGGHGVGRGNRASGSSANRSSNAPGGGNGTGSGWSGHHPNQRGANTRTHKLSPAAKKLAWAILAFVGAVIAITIAAH